MGIIRRQSIKATFFSYIGVLIGYINIIWVLPYCLSTEQIGLLRVMVDVSTIFSALFTLGMVNASQKYYPFFSEEAKKGNAFFLLTLGIPALGFLIFTVLFFLMHDTLLAPFVKHAQLLVTYSWWLLPLTGIMIFYMMFETEAGNLLRIAIPKFIREVLLRILTSFIVVLFFLKVLSFTKLVEAQVAIYAFAALAVLVYLFRIRKFSLKESLEWPSREHLSEILTYCLFIIVGGVGSMIANKIDSLMVSQMMENGLSKNGVYTTALFIATIIEIPGRAIISIAIPVISHALKENDIPKIEQLYKNSSTIQFTVGLFLFLGVWLNIDNVFSIMPRGEEFAAGKYAILFIGMAKLMDAMTSINMTILLNSKYYKISLLLILVLGGVTILTNLWLIPIYGITGAAMATALSILLYQLIATSYLYYRYKILPFSMSTIKALMTGLIVVGVVSFIPMLFNPYMDTVLRSLVISILFLGLSWTLKTSEQLNQTVLLGIDKISAFILRRNG